MTGDCQVASFGIGASLPKIQSRKKGKANASRTTSGIPIENPKNRISNPANPPVMPPPMPPSIPARLFTQREGWWQHGQMYGRHRLTRKSRIGLLNELQIGQHVIAVNGYVLKVVRRVVMMNAALLAAGFSPRPQHNPDTRDETANASLSAPLVRSLRSQTTQYPIVLFNSLHRIWRDNLHR